MSRPWRRFRKGYRRSNNANKNNAPQSNKRDNNSHRSSNDSDNNDEEEDEIGSSIDDNDSFLNVYAIKDDPNIRFHGCHLYFDMNDISKDRLLVRKVEAAENFFNKNTAIPASISNDGPSFNVNVDSFLNDKDFMDDWSSFESDLQDNPQVTLSCLGLGLHQAVINLPSDELIESLHMLRVKIFNYKPLIPSSDIKVSSYGKLIATRGCIIRVGRVKQLAQWFVFSCISCKAKTIIKQPNGILTLPKRCKECGKGKFKPVLSSPYVRSISYQVVKLQEHLDTLQEDRGKMPRILEVELFDDLVDTCAPGDDVTVVGVVKVRGTDDGIQKGKDASSNALYMEAVSIVDNKNKSQGKNSTGIVELDNKDLIAIKKIHNRQDLFYLLVHSLCPTIYGHEMIKTGLLLSLFGGTGTSTSRDDIHVLMVGDPGLGKSQMLQACSKIASQSVYVCGNASTSSGLTVTLTKEAGTTDFALEPGALVLADSGCCIIDEFDKMPTQHQALLEAMEQQSVSVAKSGIICSLEARTSILAAANPIGGRYDASKTLIENLNLSQPLLSRFDLIFLLLDRPDEQRDTLLCAHVIKSRKGFFNTRQQNGLQASQQSDEQQSSLMERLVSFGHNETIPQILLRKYVAYARQYVKPKLTVASGEILKDFYLKLRECPNIFGSLPVFTRQLEALIRLTQARAKLELRTETTEQDALDVVELFQFMVSSVPEKSFIGTLKVDNGRITGNKVRAFIALLREETRDGNTEFTKNELSEIATRGGVIIQDFNRFIFKLNDEGIILKRGQDKYVFVGD
ncbi:DNA helicase MCM8-like [Chelonus insularis]|uniref:DNA helicase MCM8-like n=1 Tax=Chelonus insularis TaxID=460826 RepID=UPI0015891837|nr:DNA helicase MCM8-like [Chelonus insularis]